MGQERRQRPDGGRPVERGDSRPRLGVAWDPAGNGSLRVTAGWGRYVSTVNEWQMGWAYAPGMPAIFLYPYDGPPVNVDPSAGRVSTADALRQLFAWFGIGAPGQFPREPNRPLLRLVPGHELPDARRPEVPEGRRADSRRQRIAREERELPCRGRPPGVLRLLRVPGRPLDRAGEGPGRQLVRPQLPHERERPPRAPLRCAEDELRLAPRLHAFSRRLLDLVPDARQPDERDDEQRKVPEDPKYPKYPTWRNASVGACAGGRERCASGPLGT